MLTDIQNHDLSLYEQLKNEVLFGTYEPGQKMKVEELKKQFGVGPNAVREALVKLAAQGLIIAEDQKGFRIPPGDMDELQDLSRIRALLENEGVGHSIDHGDLEWEGKVAAATHKLNQIEQLMLNDQTMVKQWTRYDQEFHLALMSACGSRLLLKMYADLFTRYRQYVFRELKTYGFRGQQIIDEHSAISQAALARDKARCLDLLLQHNHAYLSRSQA
ncbi:GntR family transcriptional regulator [Gynuella sp.]|uniref:GntR family transcriptional regulator n=1 Tax=Gynuella sp. TaxID=2969146 RepID=UPI003D110346